MRFLKPHIVVPLLALLFVGLAWTSAVRKSLTWDEPTFITSGWTYLDTSDFRLNPEAPPLLQQLVATPARLSGFEPPDYGHPDWAADRQVAFARDHVRRNADRIRSFATAARAPIWILGACLVLVTGAFCLRVAGPVPAVVAAVLTALSPNLLAHGRLATTDFGCAALMFGAVCCLWSAVEHNRARDWALAGLVTGMALLSKYTSLLLGPAFVLIVVFECLSGRLGWRSAARGGAIVLGVSVLLLFPGYDLGFGPARYLEGLSAIYSRSVEGFRFYLFGEVLDAPVWYYHLAAALVKTPEPTILLLGIAAWSVIRTPDLHRIAFYLAVPAALVVTASFFDQAHLGLRRILPAYPFAFALVAVAAGVKPCRLCGRVYAGLVIWAVAASLLAYPHYLAYFNVLSGGTDRAPYLLDDSNVDWGQDLPALADWQNANPEVEIRLRYFGTVEPSLYGVAASRIPDAEIIRPQPGIVYAVSAHNLVNVRKAARQANRPDVDWLSRYAPFERVGGSIWLYRF